MSGDCSGGSWLDRYVGLPWKIGGREFEGGIDCWGLVRLVLAREAGVHLPAWVDGRDALSPSLRNRGKAFSEHLVDFERVPDGRERPLDIATLFISRCLWHVGILVERPHLVLHIENEGGSGVEDWSLRPDFSRQFGGFYRAR